MSISVSDFDQSLKKPVSSRYGSGIFQRCMRSDGTMFNVSFPPFLCPLPSPSPSLCLFLLSFFPPHPSVSSRYGSGIFQRCMRSYGTMFNVSFHSLVFCVILLGINDTLQSFHPFTPFLPTVSWFSSRYGSAWGLMAQCSMWLDFTPFSSFLSLVTSHNLFHVMTVIYEIRWKKYPA